MSIIQTAEIMIPNDPLVIKQIKDACVELSSSMTRMEAEKDFQKEALKALSDDTEIPTKYLKKIAMLHHKSTRDQVEAEGESALELYDKVFQAE
jgi:hypothetical protein